MNDLKELKLAVEDFDLGEWAEASEIDVVNGIL